MKKQGEPKQAQIHQNVMELLVYEEIQKQMKHYPKELKPYINQVEVATYALNRLPTLYASCEEGKNKQKQLGQEKYQKEITSAVRRALAAIGRDPLRNSMPLTSELETKWLKAQEALEELNRLLEQNQLIDKFEQDLDWSNLVKVVQCALNKAAWSGETQITQAKVEQTTIDIDPSQHQYHFSREPHDISEHSAYWQ